MMTSDQAQQMVQSGQLSADAYNLGVQKGLFQPIDPSVQSAVQNQNMNNFVSSLGTPGKLPDRAPAAQEDPNKSLFDKMEGMVNPQAAASPNEMQFSQPQAPGQISQPMTANQAAPVQGIFKPQAPQSTVPQLDMLGAAEKGMGMEAQGISQAADVASKQAQANMQAYKAQQDQLADYQNQLAQGQKERQDAFKSGIDNYNTMSQKLMDSKIDPNRMWHDASTGMKITGALALAFGAFGAAQTGGPNQALQIINSAIDRDLQGQLANKENMQKGVQNQMNLINLTSKFYDDKQSQILAAKALSIDQVMNQINQNQAMYGGQMAQAQKQEALGKLMLEKQQLLGQIGFTQWQRQALMQGGSGQPGGLQNAKGSMPPMDLKEANSRLVPGVGYAATEDSAKKMIAQKATLDDFKENMQRLIDFRKQYGPTILDRDAVSRGKTLAGNLQSSLRTAEDMGVWKKSEAELLNNLIPSDPTSIFQVLPQLEEIQKETKIKEAAFYKAHGFNAPTDFKFNPAK